MPLGVDVPLVDPLGVSVTLDVVLMLGVTLLLGVDDELAVAV